MLDKLAVFNLSQEKAEEVLISAYAVNSWVQNFETATLFYGDIVQYNHEKEEMHKRNSVATSGGLKIRTDNIKTLLMVSIYLHYRGRLLR